MLYVRGRRSGLATATVQIKGHVTDQDAGRLNRQQPSSTHLQADSIFRFVILYQDEEKSSATRKDRSAKSALTLATGM